MDIYINIDSLDQKSAAVVSNTDLRSKPLQQIVAGTNTVINLYTTSNAGATNIQDYTTVRLGIGGVNEVPTSGSYTVTNSSGSATINYDDTASEVSTALSSIISQTFTVSEIAPQTFKIDFTNNGSVSVPTVDSSSLSPASTARFLIMVQGSASAPAQWLLKTNVNPIAYVDTFTNISSQGITGVLNTSTAGIYKELQSQKFFKSTLEVEVVDSSSRIHTILQVPVGIKGEVVHNNTAAPASVDTSPYALESELAAHENDSNNPHSVTKTQVGLGNVDNTSDADKPISTAVQTALDLKASASDVSTNTSNIATKAPTANPTFTGNATAPLLTTSEIQAVAGSGIQYDSIEHRFRDEDEQPNNLLVIKKTDGVPIGKVGINHNNPKVALHVVGGHVAAGGIDDEALRVVGSGLFTSDNSTALVVAMDTDNNANTSDAILKLKRDERASETGNVEEINLGFVGTDTVYANQTSNAAYLQIEKGRFLEVAIGTSATLRFQVNDLGVKVQGTTQLGSMSTSDRDAMTDNGTAQNGMIIYNSSEDTFQGFADGAWTDLSG